MSHSWNWFFLLYEIFNKSYSFVFWKHPFNLWFLSFSNRFFSFITSNCWIFRFSNYMCSLTTSWSFYLLIFLSLFRIHLSSQRFWFNICLKQ
jgi:hypothetical protein